ncbi:MULTISPECIES: hypothetical protein [Actinomadura]|uniref:DUF222 domain-containing protein n=1 Tax=Actinomadura yumaensis TaxID=111807 RepID=A0ABW2CU39_9ACTN|nr:hypothetical protein [Actinomadura sp. J1-007]MWK39583.1 hypothetical protein [Actinomadura sp. J1-007]
MAGMGPAPKPADQRARRNASVAMTRLPADGRSGRTPSWPLLPDVATRVRAELAAAKATELRAELEARLAEDKPVGSLRRRLEQAVEQREICAARLAEQRRIEAAVWRQLWKTPQAVAWERLGWTRDVAQYVRHKVLAELGELDAAKEARQWSDRLGLNPLAMLRLRWEVTDPAAEQAPRRRGRGASRHADLRVVGDPAATP